jgi:murein DD-endopeptidase MepM/ murein hydrolase activator NlpD
MRRFFLRVFSSAAARTQGGSAARPRQAKELLKRRSTWVILGVLVLGAGGAGESIRIRRSAERQLGEQARAAQADVAKIAAQRILQQRTVVKSGATFSKMLSDLNFDSGTVYSMTEAARKVFNLRQIRPGRKLMVWRSAQGELRYADYHIDPEHDLWITKDADSFHAEIKETPAVIRTVPVSGEVKSSLFDGVMDAGETPELAVRLADIFAWDVDFNTDTQPGDTFRLVVEKKEYADGSDASYGRILAAEYNNAGHLYQAVLFHDSFGKPAYYSAKGQSLQKLFLRSPLRFAAHISSHFSLHRFHPILKIVRPHLGTDYAAPTGTPVQAIANGRVVFAGRKGGDGNLVQLAHSRGYQTYYMHLSRILVHRGQTVRQGQTIGLVGATGLATGPHLDFRLRQSGRFVDFEHLRLPPAQPVAKADQSEFAEVRDRWMALLPPTGTKTVASGKVGLGSNGSDARGGGQP